MTDSPTRYVVYARQSLSQDPDQSLSIDFQIEECTQYALAHGGVVVGTFSDPDTRGWRRHRPGFDAMLDTIRQGRADSVLLYKLSRFARNLMIQEEVVGEIAAVGGEIVSITEPHISTSVLMRQIMGAINEDGRRVLSDWLKSAFAARARKGLVHGYAPIGYRKDDMRLVPDDETAPVVRQVWDWALQGIGTVQITANLNDRGERTQRGNAWNTAGVRDLLRNPVYAGHVHHRGEIVVRDAHPGIVTDAEFAAVQNLIDRRSYQRRKAAPSWTEGFVWHACGQRMYLTVGDTTRGAQRPRYRCHHSFARNTGGQPLCTTRPSSISVDKVEQAMVMQLGRLVDRRLPLVDVQRNLQAAAGAEDRKRVKERARLERQLASVTAHRQRLLDLVLEDRVDPALYAERDDAIRQELDTLRRALTMTPEIVSPAEVASRHARLAETLGMVSALAKRDPALLIPLLVELEARCVIGDGPPRLEVGLGFVPYLAK